MINPAIIETVQTKYHRLCPLMNERMRRQWAACEALALDRGGVAAVAQATGLSRTTIWAGMRALHPPAGRAGAQLPAARSRTPGGGRHPLVANDPPLVTDLEALVEPTTRGDPVSPLRWTCKSTRQLAAELQRRGHAVGYRTVAALLHALDYSLQAPRKTSVVLWAIRHPTTCFRRSAESISSISTRRM